MPSDETVCKYCGASYFTLHKFQLLEEKIKAMEKELKFYKGSVEWENQLQNDLRHLRQKLEQNRTDCEYKTERLRVACVQLQKREEEQEILTKELRNYKEEVKAVHIQLQILGSYCLFLRINKELKEKEDSLAQFQEKSRQLQEDLAETERAGENCKIRKELKFDSYQNRIEQLQDSLRRRILNNDSRDAMQKYEEESTMELTIERQKNEELIKPLQNQQQELKEKETVRLECEECYELTEALTQAREHLIELKRVSGSLSLSHRMFHSDKAALSNTLANPGTGITSSMSEHRHSSHRSFPLLPSPPPPAKERVASVTDMRQTITAVLKGTAISKNKSIFK
ncbi:hypothetical protein XELAEV_18029765mg [Xenopus laevis]|uniref:Leucine, glutamate and lysine rich 1 n=1 Tax=Xenopus laevis TaxID=8355 RepID=A0A974HHY6_XENLA|nr:hypothetical protein XELAEV_18029765mg [Xenopus laevis]